MFIQKCKNCSKKFKWSTIIKSILGDNSIKCDNCKTKHYLRFINRIIISVLIPLPILFQKLLFSLFSFYSIFIYLIWVFFIIFISPFFATYYIK